MSDPGRVTGEIDKANAPQVFEDLLTEVPHEYVNWHSLPHTMKTGSLNYRRCAR